MKHWYALHTKPRKEKFVNQLLLSKDINVFYPEYQVTPKNPRSSKTRPWFPGYMFVHINLSTLSKNTFKWIPGTHGLVAFGGQPGVLPDQFIYKLRKHVNQLDVQNSVDAFKQGNKVSIVDGPLTSYEAIFDAYLPGKERVKVFLSFFSQHTQRVELNLSDIQAS